MLKHICFIAPSLMLGGAERSLVKLANSYVEIGQKVTVITFSKKKGLQYALDKDITVQSLNDLSSSNPLLWWKTYKLICLINPDIVFGWSLYANLVCVLVSQFLKIKIVLSERNYLPEALNKYSCKNNIRLWLTWWSVRYLYSKAAIITANSKQNLHFLQNYIGTGPVYKYLPNMIDVNSIDEYTGQNKIDIPNIDSPHILAVGRLVHQKGFDVLLEAFAIVLKYRKWSLVIVGDGSENINLQSLAKKLGIEHAVCWLGSKENPFPYYRWSDIVVIPSRFEGFPNVPLEAMACAKAVICSDCDSGPRELTCNGQYGKLVEVGDVEALADEIMKLGDDIDACKSLGDSAKEHIKHTYDKSIIQHQLMSFLP
jgi:glycosyltransferase involved in cell wall biosynthesis